MYSVIALLCFSSTSCEIIVPPPPITFFVTSTRCAEAANEAQERLEEVTPDTTLIITQCVNWRRPVQ